MLFYGYTAHQNHAACLSTHNGCQLGKSSLPISEGHHALLANKVLVAVILRMHRHCGIAQNSLRPCCGHRQVLLRAYYLILEEVQVPGLLAVFNLHSSALVVALH